MTDCKHMEERLNDHLDGLLDETERQAVDRHLGECSGCRKTMDRMRSLTERSAGLPESLEPERDLWPEIEAGLKAPGKVLRPRFPWLATGTPGAWWWCTPWDPPRRGRCHPQAPATESPRWSRRWPVPR